MGYQEEQELERELAELEALAAEGGDEEEEEEEEVEGDEPEDEGEPEPDAQPGDSQDPAPAPPAESEQPAPKLVPLEALQEARRINQQLRAQLAAKPQDNALPTDPKQLGDMFLDDTGKAAHLMLQQVNSVRQESREAIEQISVDFAQRQHTDFWDVMGDLVQAEEQNPVLAQNLAQIRATSKNPAEDLYQYGLAVRAADPTRMQAIIDQEAEKRAQAMLKEQLKGLKGDRKVPSPGSAPKAPANPPAPVKREPTRAQVQKMSLKELEALAEADE